MFFFLISLQNRILCLSEALLMSTHNVCLYEETRKNISTFWLQTVPYMEICHSGCWLLAVTFDA